MKIVALSDLHGHLPDIEPCELLIIAGDICPDRIGPLRARDHPSAQREWLDREFLPWLDRAPALHKIATWGNHDWCGQSDGLGTGTTRGSTTDRRLLVDDQVRIPIGRPDGVGSTDLTVWCTPWSNTFMRWAFMKSPAELATVYGAIPSGTDIIVSHQPPYGYGDRFRNRTTGEWDQVGSHELLATIDRVKPRLVICGHFHEGHGHFRHHDTDIYNVSIVDDRYQVVRGPTTIAFA